MGNIFPCVSGLVLAEMRLWFKWMMKTKYNNAKLNQLGESGLERHGKGSRNVFELVRVWKEKKEQLWNTIK